MSRKNKRLERLRSSPQSISFDELRHVLEDNGFILDRTVGSHHVFEAGFQDQVWKITVPFKKPHIKPVYVKKALAAIDEIIAAKSDENEEGDDNE